jgi:hypothetical protein
MRRHFGAAIAADGQQTQTLAFGRVGQRVQMRSASSKAGHQRIGHSDCARVSPRACRGGAERLASSALPRVRASARWRTAIARASSVPSVAGISQDRLQQRLCVETRCQSRQGRRRRFFGRTAPARSEPGTGKAARGRVNHNT